MAVSAAYQRSEMGAGVAAAETDMGETGMLVLKAMRTAVSVDAEMEARVSPSMTMRFGLEVDFVVELDVGPWKI